MSVVFMVNNTRRLLSKLVKNVNPHYGGGGKHITFIKVSRTSSNSATVKMEYPSATK